MRRIQVANQGEVEKARMETMAFTSWPLFDGQNWLFAQIDVELLALMEEGKSQPGPAIGPMRVCSIAVVVET
ncbi:hypothetical protein KSF_068830 [Reticulibacter mediterranei]|uniref:Uncharacterized protein n=1 Tax=Reticulibacter mediterranei TaxID=2778369 RepID=A0A8J3N5X2_9CHLR|nr:hypothetical protein KSF_068830 [Reticulibacter mediterranei]